MICTAHAEVRRRVALLLQGAPPLEFEDVAGLAVALSVRLQVGWKRSRRSGPDPQFQDAAARALQVVAEVAPALMEAAGWLPRPAWLIRCRSLAAEFVPAWDRTDVALAWERLREWDDRVLTPLAAWSHDAELTAATGIDVREAVLERFDNMSARQQHILLWQCRLAPAYPHPLSIGQRETQKALGYASWKLRRPFAASRGDLDRFRVSVAAGLGLAGVFVGEDGHLHLDRGGTDVRRLAREFVRGEVGRSPPPEACADSDATPAAVPTVLATQAAEVSVRSVINARLAALVRAIRDLIDKREPPALVAAMVWVIGDGLRNQTRAAPGLSRRERPLAFAELWGSLRKKVPELPAETAQRPVARAFNVTRKALRMRLPEAQRQVRSAFAEVF